MIVSQHQLLRSVRQAGFLEFLQPLKRNFLNNQLFASMQPLSKVTPQDELLSGIENFVSTTNASVFPCSEGGVLEVKSPYNAHRKGGFSFSRSARRSGTRPF